MNEYEDIDKGNQALAETMRSVTGFAAIARATHVTILDVAGEGVNLYTIPEAKTFHRDAQRALVAVDQCRASMARFLERIECPTDPERPILRDMQEGTEVRQLSKWELYRMEFWRELGAWLHRFADRAEERGAE